MSNEVAAEETPDLILEEKPIPGFVRVDLLPQEIIEKEAIRKARNFAAILLVVALFIIVIWRLFLQLQIQSDRGPTSGRDCAVQRDSASFLGSRTRSGSVNRGHGA